MTAIERSSVTAPLLGGLAANQFLRRHWQKRPLLIRQAVPGFRRMVDRAQMLALATHDEVRSRLVSRHQGKWRLRQGPLSAAELSRLPRKDWTLLVQEINHHLPAGWDLLRRFDFIPLARLDDLMVSYAVPGGGVGPHLDSYDVFLLQGEGRRRWQIAAQPDQTMVEGLPLKILKNFCPRQEWILEPGDMLYLPPNIAHCGTALDECFTYSIGFRAPAKCELMRGFLDHLHDQVNAEGLYDDRDLVAPRRSAQLSDSMIGKVQGILRAIRWNRATVESFLGRYLTEPNNHVFFVRPGPSLSRARFAQRLFARGVELDLKTRVLICGKRVFINGDEHPLPPGMSPVLTRLAQDRGLTPRQLRGVEYLDLMYDWYQSGYVKLPRGQP